MASFTRQVSPTEAGHLYRGASTTHALPVHRDPFTASSGRSADVAEQSVIGNHVLQQLLRRRAIQARLTVNSPGDASELEAERVANEVMSWSPVENTTLINTAARGKELVTRDMKRKKAILRRMPEETSDEKKKPTAASKPKVEEPPKSKPQSKPQEKKNEEGKIKRQVDQTRQEDEEYEELRRESAGAVLRQTRLGETPVISEQLEQRLDAQRGRGLPMTDEVRSYFEPRFGVDFGAVRLHTDAPAAVAANELNAQAFTRGRDVYFAAGQYRPQSDQGRHLLAHELTHTMQQGGAGSTTVGRDVIQRDASTQAGDMRDAGTGTGQTTAPVMSPASGVLDEASQTITFDQIKVPDFKLAAHRGTLYGSRRLRQRKSYRRGNPEQRNYWKEHMGRRNSAIIDKMRAKLRGTPSVADTDSSQFYIFRSPPGGPPRHYLGDLPTVAKELTLPSWSENGNFHNYDVDHIVELQLSNWPEDTWANTLPNMELLESSTNRSSGSTIKNYIDQKCKEFNNATGQRYASSTADLKSKYSLEFAKAVPAGDGAAAPDDYFWTPAQIEKGQHIIDKLSVVNAKTLDEPEKVLVFPGSAGVPRQFSKPPAKISTGERDWLKPYQLIDRQFNTEQGSETTENLGELKVQLPHNPDWTSESRTHSITVKRLSGTRFGGQIDKAEVRRYLARMRKKGLSPIQIHDFDILPEGGLYASGQIIPDISLLRGGIDFELSGGALTLTKEFGLGDFNLPKPFMIRGSTLTISLGTRTGLRVGGRVDFGIERVGEGFLGAEADTSGGFALEGQFNFDSRLFNPASIRVAYRNRQLAVGGRLGIPRGKVRGIKSALINVDYSAERLSANGAVEPDIPGVRQASLNVVYSETEGLTIGGALQLADNIPGIRGGEITAELKRTDDESGWKLKAHGTAQPAFPGVSGTLTADYDDGAFVIQANLGLNRGMLSGTLVLGATNRGVDEQGNPSGPPGERLRAFGRGNATVRLTPWLTGTVGIRILPNGELELMGQVALPSAFEVFPSRRIEKSIFSIGLDIPIVGVAVAGQRIGIFATVCGGLTASAGFGPGQLRDVAVTLTYNPDHEERTHLVGTGRFYVPADAGLRLFVRGGLGAGIPVVSATAALEVGGQLGIEGAAQAGVNLDWVPGRGLALDAEARLSAQPKFRFDVNGMVLVKANLLVTSVTLYEKTWRLAAFEYGSALRFGVCFPIHYRSGEPFDVKVSDMVFETPRIEPKALLSDLIGRIT